MKNFNFFQALVISKGNQAIVIQHLVSFFLIKKGQ